MNQAADQGKDKGETNKQSENNNNSLSTRAYELFPKAKFNNRHSKSWQSEAERSYKEYWKLKQICMPWIQHVKRLKMISYISDLYKLAKLEGMRPKEVINFLGIVNNKDGNGPKEFTAGVGH